MTSLRPFILSLRMFHVSENIAWIDIPQSVCVCVYIYIYIYSVAFAYPGIYTSSELQSALQVI